ncbi:MAG: DUF3052 domain-containing protein [Candidatus Eisenbacteria bacterium]|uniref:DUF3052 domain-containing protein n=1 Tax=Eiseniibacteriota bacterium TaxID=2212470 RepID=A0A849SFQ5_UNCEI|nr:DUF3052 domain-containing protein [Candidatus Eisenbacteria bacterium]
MGREKACTAVWRRQRSQGRALLESSELIFRGEFRVRAAFSTLRGITVRAGMLKLDTPEGVLSLELGDEAERWADRIRNPKSVLDKLGVKPAHTVAVIGVSDAGFLADLSARAATVSRGRVKSGSDLVFLGVERLADLARLTTLREAIAAAGGVWVVWAKGRRELNEDHVRAAALRARLVDVKVVAFSPTHSALKLVIPLAQRTTHVR